MNNILFVGHDIEYLKFYINIQNNFEFSKSFHAYIRPSAELYSRFLGNNTLKLSSLRIKKNINDEKIVYPSEINFYKYGFEKINAPHDFLILYNKYFNLLEQFIINNEINKIILPGEYRLFEQAVIECSKKYNINVLFFEAGPPKYIYFDKKGVNANVTFKNYKKKSIVNDELLNKRMLSNNKEIFNYNKILKSTFLTCEIIIYFITYLLKLQIDYIEYIQAFKNRIKIIFKKISNIFFICNENNKNNENNENNELIYNKKYLFLDQVKSDVNYTHFSNIEISIKSLKRILENDNEILLVWRFHPLQNHSELYSKIKKMFPYQVTIDNKTSLFESLKNTNAAITVNSNAGLECLSIGKKLLVLGDSYYINCFGVLKDIIDLEKDLNKKDIINSYNIFLSNNFISLDYRNSNYSLEKINKLAGFIENEV